MKKLRMNPRFRHTSHKTYKWLCVKIPHLYFFNRVARKTIVKHENTFSFLKALALNPRTTGAVLPSSSILAREMVSHVDRKRQDKIIDLGAGTGVITRELLRRGIDPKRIVAVEYSSHLVKKLHLQFPNIEIIEGNAVNLYSLLATYHNNISDIISGLPLRSLPPQTANTILQEIAMLLDNKGKYIQFTYSMKQNRKFFPDGKKPISSKKIWRNLPPARVDVFKF